MNKLKPLYEFYKAVLSLSSMTVDDDGYVSVALAGAQNPCMIDGHRLLMPYDKTLKEFDPKQHRIFHPLLESLTRGESEVLEKMRTTFVVKANYVFSIIGAGLLNILSSPELHAKMSPDQATLLENIKDNFEGSTVKWAEGVVTRFNKNKSPPFIDMRLKKLGVYKGKKYPRLGVVFFPFYESMVNRTHDEINLQVREVKLYKQLTEYMFDMTDKEICNRPTDSDIAPFLVAYVKSAIAVAEHLNHVMDLFKDFLFSSEDDYKNHYFHIENLDIIDNLSMLTPLIRLIPAQIGNDGRVEKSEETAAAPVDKPAISPAPKPASNSVPPWEDKPNIPPVPMAPPPPVSAWGAMVVPAMPTMNPMMGRPITPQDAAMMTTPGWATANTMPAFYQQQMPQQSTWAGISTPQTMPMQMPFVGGMMGNNFGRPL